jgi:hypothetical protein
MIFRQKLTFTVLMSGWVSIVTQKYSLFPHLSPLVLDVICYLFILFQLAAFGPSPVALDVEHPLLDLKRATVD